MRGTELLELAPGESVTDAVAELESRPDVLYAEPNYVITASGVPNDTSFSNLWVHPMCPKDDRQDQAQRETSGAR